MKNIVAIDVETTGLNTEIHQLLTIGIVATKSNGDRAIIHKSIQRDHSKIVDTRAIEVNKIDLNEHDKVAIAPEDAKRDIVKFMSKFYGDEKVDVVLGHNVSFDIAWMKTIFTKEEFDEVFTYRSADTAGIGRFLIDAGLINAKRADLSSLMEFFGLGNEQSEGRHSAVFDAQVTLDIYHKMIELVKR